MHVVHGIDCRSFHPADPKRPSNLILAVGRLTPKKGFDRLVAACALLQQDGREFRCEIIGEGRLRGELQAAIDANGLGDRVRIRSFVAQEDLVGWYRRAAVLAAPAVCTPNGNRDGIPNVVVEAMACGLAVVGSRVGGIPEMVEDGHTGALVSPGDVGALAGALAALLDDPERAERLGRSGAAKVAKLDFRQTQSPLIERLSSIVRPKAVRELHRVAERA